ncbi:MAG: hypothetical protein QOG51_1331 [Verrucomicrobiota bacterium]
MIRIANRQRAATFRCHPRTVVRLRIPPGKKDIVRRFQRVAVGFILAVLALTAPLLSAASVRVTTWNLEWFPNGSPKELPPAEQEKRIAAAAGFRAARSASKKVAVAGTPRCGVRSAKISRRHSQKLGFPVEIPPVIPMAGML